jgi:hypothetical protein
MSRNLANLADAAAFRLDDPARRKIGLFSISAGIESRFNAPA